MAGGFDLVVEGGTVVTARGRRRADVYVKDGRVAQVSEERLAAAARFDAGGLLVMPGMVDAHVHFMDPGDPEREDFPSASEAALRSGVTTVVEHTHAAPVRSAADLSQKVEHLRSRSLCDFALGAHAWPGRSGEIGGLLAAGAAFIKVFTCTTHGIPGHDRAALVAIFDEAAAAGAVCLVHCEDDALVAAAEERLRAAGRSDGGVIPEWRNRAAEQQAVAQVVEVAQQTGARVVIAHASNPDVIRLGAEARGRGARLAVETCPQYLTLLESEVLTEGAFRKFTPPARARNPEDLTAMWSAVRSGGVNFVSSDHAPSTRAQKEAGSIWDVHFGLPGVDTTFSVLLDAAAHDLLTYERVVELYSHAPARLYGLEGKGSLEPGADADLVVVDPTHAWTVEDAGIRSRAGWSPYSGRTLVGRSVATFLRGVLVMESGTVDAEPGLGRFVPARTQPQGIF
jgi:dihydroorotase (multifunctional complex type)